MSSAQHAQIHNSLETKLGTGASTPVNNTVLRGNGAGSTTYAQVNLTTDVGNLLPIQSGGTNASTLPSGLLVGAGVGAITAKTAPTGAIVGDTDTQTLSGKTITAPKVDQIKDTNGNPSVIFTANASAVNGLTFDNAATTFWPVIKPTGSDANIHIQIQAKGTGGIINNSGTSQTIQSYTPIAGGTATLDLSKGNLHFITMPAGNITIAVSNGLVGQPFIVRILQDSVGSRTVTWFTTIKWAGGNAPTLTTTLAKTDTFGFITTSSGNYDGFIVGQNL